MTTSVVTNRLPPAVALKDLERVVIEGDLSALSDAERIAYVARVCESVGLNVLTRPIEYLRLNNKLVLYVTRSGTDQLRDIHGVSISKLERERDDEHGLYIVVAYAVDRHGREDSGMGVVSIAGLKGEALANSMMKAETKAKRRATLSICGLGWMDEVEAVDARAVEVAPRKALAEGIASRRAALESAPSEAPAADVSPGEDGRSVAPSSPAAACDHKGAEYEATPHGLKCTRCGRIVAAYDGEVVPEPKPAARRARTAAKAKSPGDDGYGTARAHAVASERGLDHDAVHRIAFDVIRADGVIPIEEFSVKGLSETAWDSVIAAISEAPIPDDEAEGFAGSQAAAASIGDRDNPWPEAEPMAADMFGAKSADELTPAQWREFGIRVAARADA